MSAGDASYLDLQQGDARAYEALAQAVRGRVTELLIPFNESRPHEIRQTRSLEQIFQQFILDAKSFSHSCSEDCAKIMRQSTRFPEVLATPTLSLAQEIRQATFEKLDHKLEVMKEFKATIDNHKAACESKKLDAAMLAQGYLLLAKCQAVFIDAAPQEARPEAQRGGVR